MIRQYSPNYEATPNYISGMRAIQNGQLPDAMAILSSEAVGSPCYGLALANKALVQLRLEQFDESEATANLALAQFDSKGCPHPPTWVQTIRNLGEAIGLQGRLNESLLVFKQGCVRADKLAADFPDFAEDCLLEKAHTLNSWGGSLLKSDGANDALDCFIMGRAIYNKYPNNIIGRTETLTNLAQAYNVVGKKTEASLALDEARQLANGDEEHLHRINIAAARAQLCSEEDARRFLLDAASAAERAGFFETAYLRHCIAAFLADEYRNPVWGMEVVRRAIVMEERLEPKSLQPARLRFYKASFLEQSGQPVAEVLTALLEGARLWCERLPASLALSDYQLVVGMMHDHFRKLSRTLLDEGRNDEAFVAFEVGRARAFTVEVSGNHTHPFLVTNPFGESMVDCAILNRIQAGIISEHLIISLAVLPPKLVAYIIGRESVEICQVDLVTNSDGAERFGAAIKEVSANLENGRGIACLPDQAIALVREIAGKIGTRSIVLLAPHALLHKVPWGALFRHVGIEWSQLPFVTQFSPLLNLDCPNPDAVLPAGAVALGHGVVGTGSNTLNLEDEAQEFAQAYGIHGQLIKGARSTNVTTALHGEKTALISCHGNIVATEQGDRFLFELADGGHTPGDLIQDEVTAPFVILSACSSGVYEMAMGDYPVGAAPAFLLAGARFCICTRFRINAHFAQAFFPQLGKFLAEGQSVAKAFTKTLGEMENQGHDLWRHLACVALLGRGIYDTQ